MHWPTVTGPGLDYGNFLATWGALLDFPYSRRLGAGDDLSADDDMASICNMISRLAVADNGIAVRFNHVRRSAACWLLLTSC